MLRTPRALKGYDKNSLPVHWYSNSSGWMTGNIFQASSKTQLFYELKEYCTSQGLPFKILMLLDNNPAHPHWLSDLHLHSNIKFFYLLPNTTFLLQSMDQDVIKMLKAYFLQKSWCSLSMKCDVFLNKLEKAAQAPENPVELQNDMMRRHWKSYTIRDALWHVRDAWKEVMASCIRGACKKLYPHLTIDFRGFNLNETLSKELLKCLELARRVGLDEVEEDDVDSLLELIGEELEELQKQRHQLEEEVEAEQHPTAPPTKQLTLPILQCFFRMLNDTLDYLE